MTSTAGRRIPGVTFDRAARSTQVGGRLLPVEARQYYDGWRVWCGLCRTVIASADGDPVTFESGDGARDTARLHAVTHHDGQEGDDG